MFLLLVKLELFTLKSISTVFVAGPNGSIISPLVLNLVTECEAKSDSLVWSSQVVPLEVALVTWESPYNTVRIVDVLPAPTPLSPDVSVS